jgi:glyoxylase-like metal-dependent hydrolase (beta-lactamase superfamily II)
MRIPIALLSLVVLTTVVAERPVAGQTPAPAPATTDEIRVLPLRPNVFMLVGPGGNTVVQVEPASRPPRIPGFYQGSYGVVVVDTQPAAQGEALRAAIRRLSQGPIRFVINTHIHDDHIGGNEAVARRDAEVRGGDPTLIVSHENVLLKLAEEGRVAQAGLPTCSIRPATP